MKPGFLLFILIPVLEIVVLLISGKLIGIGWTIAMLFITAIIGVYLAKRQGAQTINKLRQQLSRGEMPGEELYNGICILIGGLFLLLPGFISDLIGLTLLIPMTRKVYKPLIYLWIRKYMKKPRKNITIIR